MLELKKKFCLMPSLNETMSWPEWKARFRLDLEMPAVRRYVGHVVDIDSMDEGVGYENMVLLRSLRNDRGQRSAIEKYAKRLKRGI